MSNSQIEKSASVNTSFKKRLFANDNIFLFLGLVVYIIVCSIIAPNFATGYNVSIVLEQLAVPGILSVGMCVLMISGGIDLSVGTLLSFAACSMAWLIYGGTPVAIAVIVGVLICVVCNFLMGLLLSRTTLEPFIVSVGAMIIYKGFALITTNGAEYPIPGKFGFSTNIRFFNLPLMVYIMILVYIIFALLLRYTKFGRWLYAVGDNEEASFLAGISVRNFKLSVYVINGLVVALATILMLSRNEVGNPYLGTDLEMRAIASAVVGGTALSGGKGNIIGTLLGTIWMGIISNSLNVIGVSAFWQYVVTGGIIVIAVFVNNFRYKVA